LDLPATGLGKKTGQIRDSIMPASKIATASISAHFRPRILTTYFPEK
jgi:hypothetical protein